jgi:hypothetical protein
MPKKLMIRTIASSKLKKEYLTKDKNKEILFVYDVEMMGTTKRQVSSKDKMLRSLPNTLGLDFTKIEDDKKSVENKKKIKEQIEKLLTTSKKFKKVVMTTNKIGRKLLEYQLNKAHAYLRSLLRKYESTISIPSSKKVSRGRNKGKNNNLGTLNNKDELGLSTLKNSIKKGRVTNKKNPEEVKKLTKKIKDKLKEAIKSCGFCNKATAELKRTSEETKNRRYKSRVKKLVAGRDYCDKCVRRCDSIKTYMKYVPEDKDLYAAQYPVMCRRDHEKESRASRLAKQFKLELKRQFEDVNQ